MLGRVCYVCGFLSILASIGIWAVASQGVDLPLVGGDLAHAERFGIFVGLWAPTFFVLSSRHSSCRNKLPKSFDKCVSEDKLYK